MQIREILVNIDLDLFSPALVACAAQLAQRFNAGLIGVSAGEPSTIGLAADGSAAIGLLYEQERVDIERRLGEIAQQFRDAVPAGVAQQWRGYLEPPNAALARTARCADLIVTESNFGGAAKNLRRSTDTGELLVRAGRPVIVTSVSASQIKADTIVVGWKDCREARRAVADALPFFATATQVFVATIHEGDLGEEKVSLEEVLAWMRRHGVPAQGDVAPSSTEGPAETLESIARDRGADLVVTGGYGSGRMREWLFGGMTRDLLSDRTIHRFMSN